MEKIKQTVIPYTCKKNTRMVSNNEFEITQYDKTILIYIYTKQNTIIKIIYLQQSVIINNIWCRI